MTPTVSLSTSLCDAPSSAERVLERWRDVCQQRLDRIALGAHLTSAVQAPLLTLLPGAGLTCVELGHPLRSPDNRPAASFISEDRDERAAAVRQLSASVELAADSGVPRVVLHPQPVTLALSAPQIAGLYAEARALDLTACGEERTARGAAAFDGLCNVLDSVLNVAQRHEVALSFLGPPPWPHQLPDAAEIERLHEIFDGASLERCACVDWIYLEAQLNGGEADYRQLPPVVRLADACGLVTNLPLGCGEIPWEALTPLREPTREAIIDLAPLTRHEEFLQGMKLLAGAGG